jgi:hypothetical protein
VSGIAFHVWEPAHRYVASPIRLSEQGSVTRRILLADHIENQTLDLDQRLSQYRVIDLPSMRWHSDHGPALEVSLHLCGSL